MTLNPGLDLDTKKPVIEKITGFSLFNCLPKQ